jgi:23S rRNA (uracil1939-C5)-methyltransferase
MKQKSTQDGRKNKSFRKGAETSKMSRSHTGGNTGRPAQTAAVTSKAASGKKTVDRLSEKTAAGKLTPRQAADGKSANSKVAVKPANLKTAASPENRKSSGKPENRKSYAKSENRKSSVISENRKSAGTSANTKSAKQSANRKSSDKLEILKPGAAKAVKRNSHTSLHPVTFVKKIKVTQSYAGYMVTPPCPIFETCGGCQLQMFNDEGQLKYKYSNLIDLLGKYGKVEPIEGMQKPYHYRHKIHATFAYEKGRNIAGIYEEHTHRVVEIENCLIQDERANRIIQSILTLMPSFKMMPYDDSGRGFLRHALIRTAYAHEGVMVVLVGGSPIFPAKRRFTEALVKKHPEIKTVLFNINPRKTSMVLGSREEVLYGTGYLEDSLCDMTFRISPKAFYQVNPEQTEKLYREAVKMAALTGKERVLDAYAGIGTIGMVASTRAKEVISVELNKDAVRDAIKSARDNGVKNIYFHQADATEFIEHMAEAGEYADVVFLDPPRSGSTPAFIKAVAKLKTDRVVYVSCSPETLARDLAQFQSLGYKVVRIKPFDMFPWTTHVEVIVLLQRL